MDDALLAATSCFSRCNFKLNMLLRLRRQWRFKLDAEESAQDELACFYQDFGRQPLQPVRPISRHCWGQVRRAGGLTAKPVDSLPYAAGAKGELEEHAAILEKDVVEKFTVKSKASLAEHAVELGEHHWIGEDILEDVLLGVGEASIPSAIASNSGFSGKVIALPFHRVAKHAIGFVYLLKLRLSFFFIATSGVRMLSKGELSEGAFYLFLVGIVQHTQNLVVVFHRSRFRLRMKQSRNYYSRDSLC